MGICLSKTARFRFFSQRALSRWPASRILNFFDIVYTLGGLVILAAYVQHGAYVGGTFVVMGPLWQTRCV